jgi:hypothetical protein
MSFELLDKDAHLDKHEVHLRVRERLLASRDHHYDFGTERAWKALGTDYPLVNKQSVIACSIIRSGDLAYENDRTGKVMRGIPE